MLPDPITFDQAIQIPETLATPDVTVTLLDEKIRINLRARASERTKIAKTLGLKLPAKVGDSADAKNVLTACLGPEEWIIITEKAHHPDMVQHAMDAGKSHLMSVTDVSHRNVGFVLFGPSSASLVNVGCPRDLNLEAFPVGRFTRTVFENAPITLYRADEATFVIECWRSFGPYMRDFFNRAMTVE